MNPDSARFAVLLAGFALLVAVTCAAAGWRLAGHGPVVDLSPEPLTPQTVCCAVPYEQASDG